MTAASLPRLRLTVNDLMESTGRGRTVIYDALGSGALVGTQPGPGAAWTVLPADAQRWVEQGCPRFPRGAQR